MLVKTVAHFDTPALDVERLSRFYSDAFGWKLEKQSAGQVDYWLMTRDPG